MVCAIGNTHIYAILPAQVIVPRRTMIPSKKIPTIFFFISEKIRSSMESIIKYKIRSSAV
jgi:hypothetical protein